MASSNLGLREALALAIVARRRREASESQWRARAEAAEAEAARLREEAARRPPPPPAPLQLLASLLATQQATNPATGLAAQQRQQQPQAQVPEVLGESGMCWAEAQVATLQLWATAVGGGGALGPERVSFLAALQRYLVAKDAAAAAAVAEDAGGAGAGADAAPLTSHLLQRTPVASALELLSDLLSEAGVREQGIEQGEGGCCDGGGGRLPAEQEAALLGAACSCLAALAALPGAAASDADYALLQQAVSWLLDLAAEEPPQLAAPAAAHSQQVEAEAGAKPGGSAGQAPAPAPAVAAAPEHGRDAATDAARGYLARGELARQALAALGTSAAVGMVVLGCAASAAQATAARLLAALTAEDGSPSQGAGGGRAEAAAGEDEEAGLARAVDVQAQLLTGCLAALPRWVQEQGGVDEEFMQVGGRRGCGSKPLHSAAAAQLPASLRPAAQACALLPRQGVTSALLAAVDSCQLLALSLPRVARAMNRVQVRGKQPCGCCRSAVATGVFFPV